MTRDDLFNVNAGIAKGVVEACAKFCPDAAREPGRPDGGAGRRGWSFLVVGFAPFCFVFFELVPSLWGLITVELGGFEPPTSILGQRQYAAIAPQLFTCRGPSRDHAKPLPGPHHED